MSTQEPQQPKPWYKSKRLYSGLVFLVGGTAKIISLFAVTSPVLAAVSTGLMVVSGAIGIALGIYDNQAVQMPWSKPAK